MTPELALPLAPLTSLQVGGHARYYVRITQEHEVAEALSFAKAEGLPLVVLGGGSNLVVADHGVNALVASLELKGITSERAGASVLVTAHAGESWDDFVAFTVGHGYAGLECLSGIPGKVGATPIQNVGAYGQEVADTLSSVRVYDTHARAVRELSAVECGFAYRHSVFKGAALGRFIVLAVSYRLTPGGAPRVRYGELKNALAQSPSPSLALVRDTVIALRRQKSMVLDADDENRRSCGSFFLNPVVSTAELEHIRSVSTPTPPPHFDAGPGLYKVPAAWLIEQAGFHKGHGDGPVGLSTRHTLALVNRGQARASDVVRFAHEVRAGVQAHFGVQLVPEPVFLGFEHFDAGLPRLE